MNLVNVGYGRRAKTEAQRVSTYNGRDLFPGESLRMSESDGAGLQSPRPTAKLVNLVPVP